MFERDDCYNRRGDYGLQTALAGKPIRLEKMGSSSRASYCLVPKLRFGNARVGTSVSRLRRDAKQVQVLEAGFAYEGRVYKSLSAVAKAVTGSHCNGFWFFGLGQSGDQ